MENCLYHHHHHHTTLTLPSPLLSYSSPTHKSRLRSFTNFHTKPLRSLRVKARAGASHCEFSSLNSPLEPRSLVGKFLSGVLQNHRQLFHVAVEEELKLLADDRDAALARMLLCSDSDETLLHRFVSKLSCSFGFSFCFFTLFLLCFMRHGFG